VNVNLQHAGPGTNQQKKNKNTKKTVGDMESVLKIVVLLFPSHAACVLLYSQHFSFLLFVGS
jgi:hypothetical protein